MLFLQLRGGLWRILSFKRLGGMSATPELPVQTAIFGFPSC